MEPPTQLVVEKVYSDTYMIATGSEMIITNATPFLIVKTAKMEERPHPEGYDIDAPMDSPSVTPRTKQSMFDWSATSSRFKQENAAKLEISLQRAIQEYDAVLEELFKFNKSGFLRDYFELWVWTVRGFRHFFKLNLKRMRDEHPDMKVGVVKYLVVDQWHTLSDEERAWCNHRSELWDSRHHPAPTRQVLKNELVLQPDPPPDEPRLLGEEFWSDVPPETGRSTSRSWQQMSPMDSARRALAAASRLSPRAMSAIARLSPRMTFAHAAVAAVSAASRFRAAVGGTPRSTPARVTGTSPNTNQLVDICADVYMYNQPAVARAASPQRSVEKAASAVAERPGPTAGMTSASERAPLPAVDADDTLPHAPLPDQAIAVAESADAYAQSLVASPARKKAHSRLADLLADYERVSERVSAVQSTTAAVALEPVAEQVAETMAEAPQVDATQTTAAADSKASSPNKTAVDSRASYPSKTAVDSKASSPSKTDQRSTSRERDGQVTGLLRRVLIPQVPLEAYREEVQLAIRKMQRRGDTEGGEIAPESTEIHNSKPEWKEGSNISATSANRFWAEDVLASAVDAHFRAEMQSARIRSAREALVRANERPEMAAADPTPVRTELHEIDKEAKAKLQHQKVQPHVEKLKEWSSTNLMSLDSARGLGLCAPQEEQMEWVKEALEEELSDHEAMGTAREYDLSTSGGRRRWAARQATSATGTSQVSAVTQGPVPPPLDGRSQDAAALAKLAQAAQGDDAPSMPA
eukprot:gnl/TRDRNA2_/TRDRNA2_136186_c2_seq1.p1 gnl/TRDRNA2_/TRDRNA2_136186_c2~~gnl/TRDRNA2_/TRDRNA2_136186_c2_seq1.p1  ORF type:complete len:883 (+),score=162.37 gnl/TRDRNA2_/TRDRNA2_136186_c2_seq1:389-2650(+)